MNMRPIEEAKDPDLRLSIVALRRAAQRAREIALSTGTDLIVMEDGELRQISPLRESGAASHRVQDKD